MTRIPLATDLKTRTLAPDKDARLKNCYVEGKGDPQSKDYQTMVRKRPAATGGFPVGTGVAQGGVGSPTGLTVITADTLNTTITADTTLTSQTNVIAAGSPTIALPTSPTSGQSVSICNVGSGTITVSTTGTTISAWSCAWFIWGGYSWGISVGPTCTLTLPSTHDFGTVQFAGPSETPYSVPPTTVTYSTLGYTPCGGQLRQITTKTYSSRSVPSQYKVYGRMNPVLGDINLEPFVTGYGASELLATNNAYDNAPKPPNIFPGFSYEVLSTIPYSAANGTIIPSLDGSNCAFGNIKRNTGGYFATNTNLYTFAGSASIVTLYYLDVHEVWTYDLI